MHQLFNAFSKSENRQGLKILKTLLVGIGSPHGDDRAGWIVAQHLLKANNRVDVDVRWAESPTRLLDWLNGYDRLIVCDACRGSGDAGRIQRFLWPEIADFQISSSGTHDLNLVQTLKSAEVLGKLPPDVVVWSIEVAETLPMTGLSDPVVQALDELLNRVSMDVYGTPD